MRQIDEIGPRQTLELATQTRISCLRTIISADQHPLLQDGSVDLSLDQPAGPVWFMGGSFAVSPVPGGFLATANRTGTVPAGKALFFPIIDAECSTAEGNGSSEADLRACAVSDVDPVSGVACEIDGRPVQ